MRRLTTVLIALVLLTGCDDYPDETRSEFLRVCRNNPETVDKPTASAYCECALEGIEEHYDYGEFLRIEKEHLRKGYKPPKMREVILLCKTKHL